MKAAVVATFVLLALVKTVEARHHHHHHRYAAFSHETAHAHGTPALNVVATARESFHGLVTDLTAMGYNVGTPGCLSSGHMRHSKHHWGGACDLFNQIARNRTALRQPPPAVQIAVAARHGLTSGCVWRSPDCGHFEVPTGGHVRLARSHEGHRYSSRRAPRYAWNDFHAFNAVYYSPWRHRYHVRRGRLA